MSECFLLTSFVLSVSSVHLQNTNVEMYIYANKLIFYSNFMINSNTVGKNCSQCGIGELLHTTKLVFKMLNVIYTEYIKMYYMTSFKVLM